MHGSLAALRYVSRIPPCCPWWHAGGYIFAAHLLFHSRPALVTCSQGHPDELFLTTFSTLERLDCIDGLASVKFGNASHVVPPSSDVSDSCGSWSSEEAGGRSTSRSHSNRNRFCKFEYDHTLSVFVPLLSSFLIDRIASLPGQVVHDNTQLSVEDGPDGENVTPDVAVTGPTREPLRERAAGNPFSTPIRRQKTGSAPSSRASTPLPEEVSPKAQNVPGPYRVFSSSFHGVSMHKASQRWHAQVRFQGKRISLGYYDDETVAATAYDNVARKLGLPATKLNFAESGERLITRKNGGPMFDQQETAATAGTPSRPLTASAPVDVPSSSTLPVDADSAVDALPSMCNWSGLDFLVAAAMLPSPKPVSSSLFMLCTTSTKKRGRDTVCLEAGPEETLTINTMPTDADTYFHTKRVQAVVPSAFRPNILRR